MREPKFTRDELRDELQRLYNVLDGMTDDEQHDFLKTHRDVVVYFHREFHRHVEQEYRSHLLAERWKSARVTRKVLRAVGTAIGIYSEIR